MFRIIKNFISAFKNHSDRDLSVRAISILNNLYATNSEIHKYKNGEISIDEIRDFSTELEQDGKDFETFYIICNDLTPYDRDIREDLKKWFDKRCIDPKFIYEYCKFKLNKYPTVREIYKYLNFEIEFDQIKECF